ncbi:MAG: gamma-glutamyltransferase family protein [Planctomycetota bacterium]|nr:gamma-glutamyltransferase family protein [Planctomycetota bacterium]
MAPFDWSLPYPSRREPVVADGIVATSHPIAAQAGREMLRRGGNAADAAIATAAAMTVVEPTSNGLGSDAFALGWFDGTLHGLNGSGRSPKALDGDRLLGLRRYPRTGWDPVTVPGAIHAWVAFQERFGTLEFASCLEPAIELARDGYHVSPQTAALWRRSTAFFDDFPAWRETFLFEGAPPEPGQRIRLPDHARTLEAIAATRGEDFYRGELANRIVAEARAANAPLNASDLEEHRSEWVDPIAIDYRGRVLQELPPNGQGLAASVALGILRHLDLPGMTVDSPEVLHLQIEAMKLGFADAHRSVADPAHLTVTPGELLEDERLRRLAGTIDRTRAQDFGAGIPKPGGTIYLATADAQGNCVSWIQSNYMGFGSGVVIPGTGIAMQNRGACFTLEPGHPNAVGPEKRPYHTIIPGMLTPAAGAPPTDLMAFGVMGGFMQPQGHLQVVSRLVDYRQNPQAALDAPRWQWTRGVEVDLEPGHDPATVEALRALGHRIRIAEEQSVRFGRGQAIHRLQDGWCAGSDLRADGQAVGI